jgi:hypothetical protein
MGDAPVPRPAIPSPLERSMKTHLTIVALVNIVFGLLWMLGGVAMTFGLGLLGLVSGDVVGGLVLGTLGVVGGLLLVLLGVPQTIGGVGLLARKGWARYVLIVTSAIGLLKFPVGTITGAYSLWVLTRAETRLELV